MIFLGKPTAAWSALLVTWAVLLALGIPRAFYFEADAVLICMSNSEILAKLTTVVGFCAVGVTCVLTCLLLLGLKMRKGGSKESDIVVQKHLIGFPVSKKSISYLYTKIQPTPFFGKKPKIGPAAVKSKLLPRFEFRPKLSYDQTHSNAHPCDPRPKLQGLDSNSSAK